MHEGVDCDGVLPLRVDRGLFEDGGGSEGGGVTGGGELLFAGVVVPAQQECDTPRGDSREF